MSRTTPEKLYKYYDAETAINHVLGEGTLKWSNPFDFNDPFDNQFELNLDKITDEDIEKILDETFAPSLLAKPEHRLYLKGGIIEGVERGTVNFYSEFREQFINEMSRTCILCLTETNDNLLMWSHYAKHHTGVVVEFSKKESDTPLPLAKPVCYTKTLPKVKMEGFFRKLNPSAKKQTYLDEIIQLHTYTKSIEWAYEREYRIVSAGGGGVRSFFREDVDAVYMGCRISGNNKRKIIKILTRDYPFAKLFQASKSSKEFALIFDQIPI
jgi:hypothetical protein